MKVKSSAPQLAIVTARGRGRPRSTQPMSSVSTWLPAQTHDRLIQIANQEERSVSDIVRQVLIINIVNVYPNKR